MMVKMCLWIEGSYKIFGFSIPFHSPMFQWPASPGQRQWIQGPIEPDIPTEAWIPKDSPVGAVWALRAMMTLDKKAFLPGALQCTRI
jgi:hypothetical protein